MMKYFGFIKEHDDFKHALEFSEMLDSNQISVDEEIINYLMKGKLCVPFMGIIDDLNDEEDDDFIATRGILTDGIWCWPEYIVAYIKKYPSIMLNEEFLNHIKNAESEIVVSEEKILQLEKEFLENSGFVLIDK